MTFHVDSEVGQLRQAIVHRPGLELSRLTPDNIGDAALRRRDVGGEGQGGARRLRRGPAGQGRARSTTTASCWPRPSSCPRAGPSCSTGSAPPRSSARRWSSRCAGSSRTSTARRWPSTWSAAILKADLHPLRAHSLKWDMLRADDFVLTPAAQPPLPAGQLVLDLRRGDHQPDGQAGPPARVAAHPGHLPLPPALRRRRLRHLLRRRGPDATSRPPSRAATSTSSATAPC